MNKFTQKNKCFIIKVEENIYIDVLAFRNVEIQLKVLENNHFCLLKNGLPRSPVKHLNEP